MLNIPEDLYPKADLSSIQHIINEYINFTIKTFSNDFPTKTSLIEYLTRLCSPRDAENFLEIGSELYRLTQLPDTTIRLILLVAQIEKAISPQYPNFQSWFLSKNSEVSQILNSIGDLIRNSSNDEIKNIINNHFIEEFNQKYGISNSFANFFERYVSFDDQFNLITRFNFFPRGSSTKLYIKTYKPTTSKYYFGIKTKRN